MTGGHPNAARYSFRAYDKEKKIIIKNIGISAGTDTFLLPGKDVSMASHNFVVGIDDDKYIIVQSTRMFDKNGLEIFEGDILEIPLNHGTGEFIVRNSVEFGAFVAEMYTYEHKDISTRTSESGMNVLPLSVKYGQNPKETIIKGSIFDTPNYMKYIRFLNKP